MIKKIYGDSGIRVVIEDYLKGFEASIIAFSNGKKLFPCIPVKDYKKVGNGDTGLNTGGMGSVAPSPEITEEPNYTAALEAAQGATSTSCCGSCH